MRRVLISTKPFIFVLFLVGVTVRSAESLSSAIPLGTSTKRANSKRANHALLVAVVSCLRMTDTIVVFSVWASNMLKIRSWMTHAPVVGIWAWYRCDLVLSFMRGLAPSAATRAGLSASRGSPAGALGDLRITVRASLPGTPPRTSYSTRSEHLFWFPGDFAGLSHWGAQHFIRCCHLPQVERAIAVHLCPLKRRHLEEPSASPVQGL